MAEFAEVQTALTYIDSTNRETWVRVGTALKTEFGESGFEMFDNWSRQVKNYNAQAVKSSWKSFQVGKSNIGFVFNQAKANGFVRQNVKPMSVEEIAGRQRRNAELAKQAEIARQKEHAIAARNAQWLYKNADE